MKLRFFLFLASLLISFNIHAESQPFSMGKLYCELTHPAEMLYPIRNATCEKQHVIQAQSGGMNAANIVLWSASNHVRTDIWNDQPWQNNRPWMVFAFTGDADVNLEKAYMLGTFGLNWSFYQHNYSGGGDSSLIISEFDGVSNFLYYVSWMINMPQKYINQVAYIADKGHWNLGFDMVLALFVLCLEIALGFFAMIAGVIVGTVLNPLDTVCALPGGIWLMVETVIAAFAQFGLGIWRLANTGLIGLILTPFAVLFSFLPLKIMVDKIQSLGE